MDLSLLRKIPLLSRLDDNELGRLSQLMRHQKYSANEPIIWVGEAGDELFLILQGTVQVSCPDEAGKEVILAKLEAGAFFGDIALLDAGPRTASCRAIDPAECLVLKRDDFFGFLRKDPDAAIDILQTVGRRHRETLEKLRGVSNTTVEIEKKATSWDRFADFIANTTASKPFVIFHMCWFATWVLVNFWMVSKGKDPFDAPPFAWLSFILAIEALFLTMFVLISSNRAGEKDRIRDDSEYQVNLKAQYEIMQLHAKIDRLTAAVAAKTALPPQN